MAETFNTHLRNPRDEIEQEIAALGPWFHNLHLPNGYQTAPDHRLGDFPATKWKEIEPHLPNISGWTVLDIGCNAGFYSFELARRGARVTGIDVEPHYLRQAEWAARQLRMEGRVKFRRLQVYDLAHLDETFDLVWFMGVLYHLRYPLLALDIVTRKAKRLLMLQTLSAPGMEVANLPPNLKLEDRSQMLGEGWPKMAFIEHELEGDGTNWWAPNHACIESMLRSCGFQVMAQPGHEIYLSAPKLHPTPQVENEYQAVMGPRATG